MDNRRDFIKRALLLSGALGGTPAIFESIARAATIDPEPGSTFADAEHVVVLMQENRSFDHCFGTLRGVRGFNDPRAIRLPNGHPVWLQSNDAGETFAPFRFDLHGSNITWLGSTPHGRSDQLDAANRGKHDRWIESKRVRRKGVEDMPMTMGFFTREDLPFNYALADAFTVCDQYFCSALTSTTPNRFYLWSGTIRGEQKGEAKAFIRNDVPYGEAHWTTLPELLEEKDVSWKVYQNELTVGGGFQGEERAWLSNYGDNPLEELSQFNVRFSPRYLTTLQAQADTLPGEIEALRAVARNPLPDPGDTGETRAAHQKSLAARDKACADLAKKEEVLRQAREGLERWSPENFAKLAPFARNLHEKAFSTNTGDPHRHELETLAYEAGATTREMQAPKGDVLHQFREDVNQGRLPAVSWLVAPANFSDHPSSPWYGSWYVSEVIDILTRNPEVWKKTIFILNYDENDGYFDHVPPFLAPDPADPATGKCSPGIDTSVEYIRRDRELAQGVAEKEAREGPIGLGYRVPMIIASPWTRGGRVCSEVFDHTSVFRFVQHWLERKGTPIVEETISAWRKTVVGDLTSAFRPFDGSADAPVAKLDRVPYLAGIHEARFRPQPVNYRKLEPGEIERTVRDPRASPLLPRQEPGTKPSCALPYQLGADATLSEDRAGVSIHLEAARGVFGNRAAGSPFQVYLPGRSAVPGPDGTPGPFEQGACRSYAVAAGERLSDHWPVACFEGGRYHFRIHGPNGFFREHRGGNDDPPLRVRCLYESAPGEPGQLTGKVLLEVENTDPDRAFSVTLRDHAYGAPPIQRTLPAGREKATVGILFDPAPGRGWYDFSLLVDGFEHFEKRHAGRVETGAEGITDPFMGGLA